MVTAAQIPFLLLALAAGMLLAGIQFTGLWLTVKRLPHARRPGLLAMGSHFLRLAITAAGFVVIALGRDWTQLVAALIGFLVGRIVVTHLWSAHSSREEAA